MATNEADQPAASGDKAPAKSRTGSKPRAASVSRKKASPAKKRSTGVRASARRAVDQMPGWATTLGPVIGMGMAIGIGLFATRKQWLPHAEELEGQLRERLARGLGSDEDYAFGGMDEFGDDDAVPTASTPVAPAVSPAIPVS